MAGAESCQSKGYFSDRNGGAALVVAEVGLDEVGFLRTLRLKSLNRRNDLPLRHGPAPRLATGAGPEIICVFGPERAMMYILSAWTGYWDPEIGSLSKGTFRLEDDPTTVIVAAAYRKA